MIRRLLLLAVLLLNLGAMALTTVAVLLRLRTCPAGSG